MGTCPQGLPGELAGKYSGIATWRLLVRAAITQQVDALLLLGDVVDWSNRFFEALGPLTEGIAELGAHDIAVYAVAGNHDCEALESIARVSQLANFHLLGRGGQWEHRLLTIDGTRLQLFGWSFPERYMSTNPFDTFPRDAVNNSCLRLGLLHADRDSAGSRYAPVRSSDFPDSEVSYWLLGHIHKPDPLPGGCAWYTGSPTGMDTTETGRHGALLLEMGAQPPVVRRLPVSGLRYEKSELELGEVATVGDLQTKLVEKAREWAVPLLDEQPGLEDLVLTGRCRAVTKVSEKNLIDEGIKNLLNGNEAVPLAAGSHLWFMGVPLELMPPIIPEELVGDFAAGGYA
jgi:DNA repair exonuclease SbcCD nuclease subunit